jgi:hypothetical protein
MTSQSGVGSCAGGSQGMSTKKIFYPENISEGIETGGEDYYTIPEGKAES